MFGIAKCTKTWQNTIMKNKPTTYAKNFDEGLNLFITEHAEEQDSFSLTCQKGFKFATAFANQKQKTY